MDLPGVHREVDSAQDFLVARGGVKVLYFEHEIDVD
jgi:hypothetical protein